MGFELEREVHVNIFNISKINAEVRGDKAPKFKRLRELIGESYFDYLSSWTTWSCSWTNRTGIGHRRPAGDQRSKAHPRA